MEQSPSTGKTVTIAASIPLALQNILYTTLHDVWQLPWVTPTYTSDLILIATAMAGLIMHRNQRAQERSYAEDNVNRNIGNVNDGVRGESAASAVDAGATSSGGSSKV